MRTRYALGVLVVVGATLTGCGQGQDAAAQPLDVVADDYSFTGVGDTLTGGAVEITFRNEGKADHELVFIDIGDTSFETFSKEFPKVLEGGPFPAYMEAAVSIGEVGAGKTVEATLTLPKGDYLLFCALDDAPGEGEKTLDEPHYELGMRQNVSVEGPDTVEITSPGGTFTAKDYTFVPPSDLKAGRDEYLFHNVGPEQWHFMYLAVFPKGTSVKEAEDAFGKLLQLEEGQEPPAGVPTPEDVLDTGVQSPGRGQTFTANFQAGRTYLAACFIQDRKGGPPHAIGHKMYKAFTVAS